MEYIYFKNTNVSTSKSYMNLTVNTLHFNVSTLYKGRGVFYFVVLKIKWVQRKLKTAKNK